MFELNKKVRELKPYDPITGSYRIRLDANESYITLPPDVKNEIAEAVTDIHYNRYPDPNASAVCEGFANYFSLPKDCIVAGNGSDELISVIMNAFLQKGDKVITIEKDFSMYSFYSSIVECKHIAVRKENDYSIDIDKVIEKANSEKARLIIFSNPCNPTSRVLSREKVTKLIKSVESLVVLDEAYMDFSDQSLLCEFNSFDNLIILKTCSKAIGMAAVRLGFSVANKKLTDVLRAVKSPYNVNTVTQVIGEIIFSHPDYIDNAIKRIIESRDDLYSRLYEIEAEFPLEFKLTKTDTNFVFVDSAKASQIFKYLKSVGIAVRLMGDKLRITAGRNYENDAVCSEIKNFLRGEENENSSN